MIMEIWHRFGQRIRATPVGIQQLAKAMEIARCRLSPGTKSVENGVGAR